MKFAFADPPYLGCAKQHYSEHPEHAVYDTVEGYRALLVRLRDEFPDGWALSLHTPSLEEYGHLCREVMGPNRVRWGGWFKPFHAYKKGVRPAYAWEPIAYFGGRNKKHPPPLKGGKATTPKDFVKGNAGRRRQPHPQRLLCPTQPHRKTGCGMTYQTSPLLSFPRLP